MTIALATSAALPGLGADDRRLLRALRARGLKVDRIGFPAGESSKSRKMKQFLEEHMLGMGLARDTCVIACGGGVRNRQMMARLSAALAPLPVDSSEQHGIDPTLVEAAAFAWLARQALAGSPGNLPSVTGARGPRVLGAIYAP